MKRLVDPAVFERAAEILVPDNGGVSLAPDCCCFALGDVCYRDILADWGVVINYFDAVIRPAGAGGWWYRRPVDGVVDTPESLYTARVLGLLFCAELARDGFVPPSFEKGGAQ